MISVTANENHSWFRAIHTPIILITVLYCFQLPAYGAEKHKMMPPTFSLDTDPRKVLQSYPLGSLKRQDAFSHHGKQHATVELPNGKIGWIYNIGKISNHRAYTLVIDGDTVIDVIYYDHSYNEKNGLSALAIQSKKVITDNWSLK